MDTLLLMSPLSGSPFAGRRGLSFSQVYDLPHLVNRWREHNRQGPPADAPAPQSLSLGGSLGPEEKAHWDLNPGLVTFHL